jgi:hypothetical protein
MDGADKAMSPVLNHWVQATPDCALLFFLGQRSGIPDPGVGVTRAGNEI